jgi:hypothetical protein
MITNLKRKTIKQHLVMCATMGICSNVQTPKEWAQLMGYKVHSVRHANLAALNVAAAGKELNREMGYDYIYEHFPLWSHNKKYSPM